MLAYLLSDLKSRGYKVVEAFARTKPESAPANPLGFYLKHGFMVKRKRDEFPLVRREL
jgi:hypothetical protein